jgi:hypothetical protein
MRREGRRVKRAVSSNKTVGRADSAFHFVFADVSEPDVREYGFKGTRGPRSGRPPALRLNAVTAVQNKAHKDVLDLVIYCRDRTKLRKLHLSLQAPSFGDERACRETVASALECS